MKSTFVSAQNLSFDTDVEKLFSYLYEQYSQPVYAYVYSLLRNEYFAEEATQTTFVKLLTKVKLERLVMMAAEVKENGQTALDRFVFRVSKNCVVDFTRSEEYLSYQRKTELTTHHDKSVESNTGDHFSDEMTAALKTLPPLWAQVLKLYVLEGCSHKEIAQELSITEGHSKNCLSKAKAELRRLLTIKKE